MTRSSAASFDVVIVGAGPAGLNAALVLGRACLRVLVLDAGQPRNATSRAMHGFLSLDGLDPAELRRLARLQLEAYPNVDLVSAAVTEVSGSNGAFEIIASRGDVITTRKVLLAMGIQDDLPDIDGFTDCYGRSAFHCPYCDGWEFRHQSIVVLGTGAGGLRMALLLLAWSPDVVFCTDGPADYSPEDRALLATQGVSLEERKIARLGGKDGQLERVVFVDGESLSRRALFLHGPTRIDPAPIQKLGCLTSDAGRIEIDEGGRTSVPGVYAAGDAARRRGQHPVSQVILAAASGALAAITMQQDLMQEDVGLTPSLPARGRLRELS